MKKARAWLDKHGVEYSFHDYKVSGIERDRLERWSKKAGWETLLNRAGTTFRKLPDKAKAGVDAGKAIALMLDQPSMIKRWLCLHRRRPWPCREAFWLDLSRRFTTKRWRGEVDNKLD